MEMSTETCAQILGIPPAKLALVGEGANGVILSDGRIAFKFPKNQLALQKLKKEIAATKQVKKQLSVPVPEYIGESLDKPLGQACCAYCLLPGEPLTPAIYAAHRKKLARQLLELLDEIHTMQLELEQSSSTDFAAMYRKIQTLLFEQMDGQRRQEVTARFEDYLINNSGKRDEMCIVHGDLGGSNILCDPKTGRITGVIDWSELSWDDPAFDYSSLTCKRSVPQCREDLLGLRPSLCGVFERMDFIQYTFPLQDMLDQAETAAK